MMNSTILKALVYAAVLSQAAGCASTDERPSLDNYHLQITDNAGARRFDIELKSFDERSICIVLENWPSSLGQLYMGSDIATLQTVSGDIPARDANFGYCPGGCGEHRIAPRGELRGFIAYSAFGDEDKIAASPHKHLNYFPWPYYCAK